MDGQDETVFAALLEAAPDAMIGVDPDGVILWVNGQAERLFLYGRDEMIGQRVEMLVPDTVRSSHPVLRRGYVADPRPRPMGAGAELAGRRGDGTEFPAEISLSGIATSSGLVVCAAVRDVTDRRRAEQKFRDLLESAPDAVIGVDVDGRIVMANGQSERLFGYKRDELIGQPIEMLVPEASRPVHPERRSNYMLDPHSRPMGAGMELAARRRDGTEFPVEISLSAIETEDGLLVSAAVRDVTERIEARGMAERLRAAAEREQFEARLHQSERLESLGHLAGGVAHDFNNLLGAILNYAAFVTTGLERLQLPAGVADELLHDAAQIQRAVQRGADLTRQLLAFGRREVVRPEMISLNAVIGEVEDMLRRTIGEDIELEVALHAEPSTILADRGRLEQVLVNLAVNARDAMRVGGGRLIIDTANTDADEALASGFAGLKPGSYIRLRVSDTGHGMTPDVMQRAFEPFYTTKAKGEGTGLGLATVYGIVTQAGGYVQLYSEIDHGTTLTAMFPAADAPAAAAAPALAPAPTLGTETVLVVEDEDAMREVTTRILRRAGYQVLSADCGPAAIEVLRGATGRIDLLLTDVVMPHMLGKELADSARAMYPGMRVLFMSGYAEPVLSNKGTLEPGIVLVEKPFSEATLLAQVRDVLDV
jgi:PAS domain S-box-containing protein